MKYNTACCAEDLDIRQELLTFPGVSYVADNGSIWEEEYKDADFQIFLVNSDGVNQIRELLTEFGMSAYIEDEEVIRIN